MHSKRQMLEDIFKVSLPCNDRGHVDIATAKPALEEPALKSWQNHLGEKGTQICRAYMGFVPFTEACLPLTSALGALLGAAFRNYFNSGVEFVIDVILGVPILSLLILFICAVFC